jgi:hypothetical protein
MIAPRFVVHGVGDGIWSSVRTPKPLAPATLQDYETQLEALSQERTGMRELVSKWWTR